MSAALYAVSEWQREPMRGTLVLCLIGAMLVRTLCGVVALTGI